MENLRKLERGQIGLGVMSDQAGRYVARQEGVSDLRVVQRLYTADLYLALNWQPPDQVVQKLQKAVDQLCSVVGLQVIEARYWRQAATNCWAGVGLRVILTPSAMEIRESSCSSRC